MISRKAYSQSLIAFLAIGLLGASGHNTQFVTKFKNTLDQLLAES